MSLAITLDGDVRVIQRLDEAVKRMGSARQPLSEIGTVMVDEFQANFNTEGRRLNEQWAALAASTVREKARLGYGSKPILVRTGALQHGFQKNANKYYVRVHNPIKYFKYHQLGGPNLPRRRMIVFSERLKQEVVAVFTKFIHEAFK